MLSTATIARLAALVPVGLTVVPVWRTGRGWVRMWEFPRAQIATLGVLAEALLLRWGRNERIDRALELAIGGSLLYQSCKILPYTPLWPRQVLPANNRQAERHVRFLISNVLQFNKQAHLTLAAIEQADADIVCLVETDAWWEQQVRCIEQAYPWVQKCPLDNTYGMLLYSRLPLADVQTRFLVRDDIPSMKATVRLRSGEEFVLYAIHPRPPRPDSPTYGRDAELVLVGREIDRERRPAVVFGDLNDVAWSYTTTLFQRVSHTLDPRIGRGMFNTFHAEHPFLRYPLDHLFHTREFTVVELRRLGYTGSDHFPILIELAFAPRRKEDMDRPSATDSDRETVQDILEDAQNAGLLQG